MFYIFHGDDTHSQKEKLNDLLAKLGDKSILDLNTTRIDGPPTINELHRACDAVPFLSQARVVIVKDALTATPDKELIDNLIAYLPQLPETTRLVFQESRKLPTNHRLLKLVQQSENGHARLFMRPKGNHLNQWIGKRVRQKGGLISFQAIHMLATNIGNDLPVLDNEIEKLVLYKGPEAEIDAADVSAPSTA